MGQKVHPYGFRLGIVTEWKSRWYAEKDYARQAIEDAAIRSYIVGELRRGAISRIDIERIGDKKVQVDVHTGRPGVVIGRGGSEAERLRTGLEKLTGRLVKFNVIEVQNPELDAMLLARSVADQLEGRVSFRRAMKRAVSTALKAGAEGVRVQAQGRLGGSDMGRREWYLEGRVPLHTLRADIDFGTATARTAVGAIGVKVWVYKGDLLPSLYSSREKIAAEARLAAGGPAKRRRSARSRAERPDRDTARIIETGGGRRIIEAGGGKRIIEAGGGRRVTAGEAQSEFEEARKEAAETLSTREAAEAATAAAAPETADAPAEIAETTESSPETVETTEIAETPEPVAEVTEEAAAEDAPSEAAADVADDGDAPAEESAEEATEEDQT